MKRRETEGVVSFELELKLNQTLRRFPSPLPSLLTLVSFASLFLPSKHSQPVFSPASLDARTLVPEKEETTNGLTFPTGLSTRESTVVPDPCRIQRGLNSYVHEAVKKRRRRRRRRGGRERGQFAWRNERAMLPSREQRERWMRDEETRTSRYFPSTEMRAWKFSTQGCRRERREEGGRGLVWSGPRREEGDGDDRAGDETNHRLVCGFLLR